MLVVASGYSSGNRIAESPAAIRWQFSIFQFVLDFMAKNSIDHLHKVCRISMLLQQSQSIVSYVVTVRLKNDL